MGNNLNQYVDVNSLKKDQVVREFIRHLSGDAVSEKRRLKILTSVGKVGTKIYFVIPDPFPVPLILSQIIATYSKTDTVKALLAFLSTKVPSATQIDLTLILIGVLEYPYYDMERKTTPFLQLLAQRRDFKDIAPDFLTVIETHFDKIGHLLLNPAIMDAMTTCHMTDLGRYVGLIERFDARHKAEIATIMSQTHENYRGFYHKLFSNRKIPRELALRLTALLGSNQDDVNAALSQYFLFESLNLLRLLANQPCGGEICFKLLCQLNRANFKTLQLFKPHMQLMVNYLRTLQTCEALPYLEAALNTRTPIGQFFTQDLVTVDELSQMQGKFKQLELAGKLKATLASMAPHSEMVYTPPHSGASRTLQYAPHAYVPYVPATEDHLAHTSDRLWKKLCCMRGW